MCKKITGTAVNRFPIPPPFIVRPKVKILPNITKAAAKATSVSRPTIAIEALVILASLGR